MDEIWRERFTQAGRADAWHKKGTHFDSSNKDLTLADVIREAGMDYRIEVLPLSVEVEVPDSVNGGMCKTQLITGQNAIIRMPHAFNGATDPASVLGTCSERYYPVQNADLAAAFEKVALQYRPETAGVLKNGEIAFFTLNAGKFDVRVNGHDDAHNAYFYMFDRKTPGSKLTFGAGATRVVCYNTMQAAESSARILIPLQHTENIGAMVEAVAKALEGLQSTQQAMRDAFQMMADKTLSIEVAKATFEIAWPNPKLSQTILSLDTLTNPVDSPNASQIDTLANALSKVAEIGILEDKVQKAQEAFAARLEFVEYLRETANASLMHMADGEGLGVNGYTVLNAVSETLEHRTDRIRGDVAADMLTGSRALVMDRVSAHLMDLARN